MKHNTYDSVAAFTSNRFSSAAVSSQVEGLTTLTKESEEE